MCTLNNQKTPRDASFKLWISIERCIEIITGQSQGWLNYQRFQPSQMLPSIKCETASIRMTAMCSVKMNTVWFGDSRGFIHSFEWVFFFFFGTFSIDLCILMLIPSISMFLVNRIIHVHFLMSWIQRPLSKLNVSWIQITL